MVDFKFDYSTESHRYHNMTENSYVPLYLILDVRSVFKNVFTSRKTADLKAVKEEKLMFSTIYHYLFIIN